MGTLKPGCAIRYFGDYLVQGELAQGGMGVVYQARQVSLNRRVALKTIQSAALASAQARERFRREAEAAANLDHPNIVPIYEVGEHKGVLYFSMKLLPEGSLADALREGRWPVPDARAEASASRATQRKAARLVATLARALHHAHQRGILHRDLKPGNVLLDEVGEPHLTDFGLAKLLDSESPATQTRGMLGTPEYMSPEQAAGEARRVTTATDVYGLGAVLYELLTGRPPFAGPDKVAVLLQVAQQEPERPRKFSPSVNLDLETICLRCLAKEPDRRYASAAALAEDLDAWLEGKPIQARPVGLVERAWLWAKRKPAIAALSALSAVALISGAAGVLWQWGVAESQRQEMKGITARVQRREAERLFETHRSHDALALLAANLRLDPVNRVTATRLASALTHRNFALPATPELSEGTQINWASFTFDGTQVYTRDTRGAARFWDARTGEALPGSTATNAAASAGPVTATGRAAVADPPPGGSQAPAGLPSLDAFRSLMPVSTFSQNQRFLVMVTKDGVGRVMATDGRFTPLKPLNLGTVPAQAIPSPDGRRVVTLHDDATVGLWEVASGQTITNRTLPEPVQVLSFSSDGARVAVGSREGSVWLLETLTGRELFRRTQQTKGIYAVDFSPDGQWAASASDDATVHVWEVHTGGLVCEPMPHQNSAFAAAFSRDGQRLLTSTLHRAAHLWDIRPGAAVPAVIRDREPVRAVAFTTSPVELVTVTASGTVRAWDHRTQTLLRTVQEPNETLHWAAFDPAARRIILVGTNSLARLLDLRSGRALPLAGASRGEFVAHAFSADGGRVAIAAGATNYVCDAITGQLSHSPFACNLSGGQFPHQTCALSFSPDGCKLISACYNLHARLWDLQTGAPLADFGHAGPVVAAEFLPDGQRFVTAASDNTARIWSITNASQPLLVLQQRAWPTSARLSLDGRRVLTSTKGNAAFVWDADTGARLTPAMNHRHWVQRGLFSGDGSELLTPSNDGSFRRWKSGTGLPLGEPLAAAHYGMCPEIAATPTWDWFAATTGRPEVILWRQEPWPLPVPDWLPELAEAVAGLRLDANAAETPVPATELLRLKARFAAATATDPWTRWAKWFLADRSTGTVAWDTEVTVPAYVESLIAAGTVDSLRRAVRMAPTNALALAHLARATLTDTNNPCRLPEADFLSRRAVELAPQSAEVQRLREEITGGSRQAQ